MIIERVAVHNFGVFRGRHEIALSTSAPDQPIVLIGAMNGSGKTTLLEALKLALFGRRAAEITRARSYEDYLRDSINRSAGPTEGAAVEVDFSLVVGGKKSVYRVIRSWSFSAGAMRESVEVYFDTAFDPVLTDGWNEHVESILPIRLAPFFFFDGERLETLADASKAREFLANAIEALLGLHIVDRLSEDLRSVERRVKEGAVDAPEDQDELRVLQSEFELHDREVTHLVQRCGELTNARDQARRARDAARREFEAVGGEVPQRTLALQTEQASFRARRADALETLTRVAYEAGPLTLLRDQIEQLVNEAGASDLDTSLLEARDRHVLATLRRKRLPATALARVEAVLDADRHSRTGQADPHAAVRRASIVEALQQARYSQDAVSLTLDAIERFDAELARIDAQTAALPTEMSLAPLKNALAEREKVLSFSEAEHSLAWAALERARRQRAHTEDLIQRVMGAAMERKKQRRYSQQLVQRSTDFRRTLDAFRVRMAERHALRLGETIVEAFQCLHRKTGTIEKILVDSRTFDMTLYDGSGRVVDSSRLSAGERQLLAVAMVWAILKLAGRPLPLWIDTPLGRLDSVHRRHLIERFFPFAAPQVVLLSTDTEIDESARLMLRDHTARTYRIEFDPETSSSVCSEGYFLERAA